MLELLREPWHWAVSGAAIAGVLFLMTWMGRSFGVSTTFKNLCTLAGAGRIHPFFQEDRRSFSWRLVFIIGAVLGGFLAVQFLSSPEPIALSSSTIAHLQQNYGIDHTQGGGYLPTELFSWTNPLGVVLAIVGGFLVGFGTRYAGGCTSGHAITGLSHLQLASLVAVIGFFIGGLIMTWGVLPLLLTN